MPSDWSQAGMFQAPVLLSTLSVIALVISDRRGFRPGRYIFKPLAAFAFIWLAWVSGAADSNYGRWLLAGLAACLLGDLLLMPDSERSFLAGLFAFLCGHLLYAVAFTRLPVNLTGLVLSAVPALLLLLLAWRWLLPHVQAKMKTPVRFYMLVITAMLLCAGLPSGQQAAPYIILGAWGFALSDLAVARQQFVAANPVNQLWGTPLYFLSQMVLAASLVVV